MNIFRKETADQWSTTAIMPWPCAFTIYVVDLFQIIEKHIPEAQVYADDHQAYLSFRRIPFTNQTASVTAIKNCVVELRSWMISNMLMVNDSKTESWL